MAIIEQIIIIMSLLSFSSCLIELKSLIINIIANNIRNIAITKNETGS